MAEELIDTNQGYEIFIKNKDINTKILNFYLINNFNNYNIKSKIKNIN